MPISNRLGEAAITPPAQQAYYEEPAAIVLDITLSASQARNGVGVFVDGDGDFRLEAISGSSTGAYSLRFKTPREKNFPDSQARNSNLVGTAAFPFPLPAPMTYPAGAKISFDLTDLSGASNTVQLVLIGYKLFRVR